MDDWDYPEEPDPDLYPEENQEYWDSMHGYQVLRRSIGRPKTTINLPKPSEMTDAHILNSIRMIDSWDNLNEETEARLQELENEARARKLPLGEG